MNLVLKYVQEHCSEIQSSRSFIFTSSDRARARVKGVGVFHTGTLYSSGLVSQFPRTK